MDNDLEELVNGVVAVRWNPTRPVDDAADPSRGVGNFGDLLGPLLLERLSSDIVGRAAVRGRRVISVGSILHFARHGDIVWGSGVNGKVVDQHLPTALDVRSVRGPLTRAVLLAHGIETPELYGDPALLIPHLWPETLAWAQTKTRRLAVVPNLNELARFDGTDTVISPRQDPWIVARQIAASEFVTGTSLHALVIADALGIASRPVVPASEDPFKYIDYYAGTGRHGIRFAHSPAEAVELGPIDFPEVDLDALLRAFPGDAWGAEDDAGAAADLHPRGRSSVRRDFIELHTEGVEFVRGDTTSARSDQETAGLQRADALASLEPLAHRAHGLTDAELEVAAASARSLTLIEPAPRFHVEASEIARLATVDQRRLSAAHAIGARTSTMLESEPQSELLSDCTLSVVITAHDVAPWIGETLASVLAQDVPGMEVLVIDDHSTDGTRNSILEFSRRDERIRLIDSTTRGGANARNVGVDNAAGRYIIFCDGDDIIPDGAYAALVASLEASGSDIAFGDYLKFSPTRTWRPTQNWPAYSRARTGFTADEVPSILRGRACWNKAFRTDFWRESGIRFPEVPRSNDIVPMVTAYLAARAIDVVDDVVYLYRDRPGTSSMTSKASSATAIISYLSQELECAGLITSTRSAALITAFSSLFYEADGWVHIERYLGSFDPSSHDTAAIGAPVRGIAELLPVAQFRRLPVAKRLVLALIMDGRISEAAIIQRRLSIPDAAAPASAELDAWRAVIASLPLSSNPRLPALSEFCARFVVPVIDGAVRNGNADGATDAALLRLVRVVAEHSDRAAGAGLRTIPELRDLTVTDDELHLRIRASRSAGMRVTSVTPTRTHLDLRGTMAADLQMTTLTVDGATDAALQVAVTVVTDAETGARSWSARLPAAEFALGRRTVLLGSTMREDDGMPIRIVVPDQVAVDLPYDPYARFFVGRDPLTGSLWAESRRHWLVRGGLRQLRRLSRRSSGGIRPA